MFRLLTELKTYAAFLRAGFLTPRSPWEESLQRATTSICFIQPAGSYGSHRALAVFLCAHLPAVFPISASNGG